MELRYLRYFATVAELRSFSRAADTLHVAQSAISQQIKTLEGELEVKLLERTRRSVALTPAGRAFLREAEEILDRAEQSKRIARRAAKGEIGSISIGCFHAASSHFLPSLLQEYRAQYPEVRVHLDDLSPTQQLPAFDRGAIDLGFTRPLPTGRAEDFVQERVYSDFPVMVVSENHPAAKQARIDLRRLAAEDWVLFKRSGAPELVDGFLSLCVEAGFSPKPVSEPTTMVGVLMLVAAGAGVSIVPRCLRFLEQPGIRFLPLRPAPAPIDLVIARPKGDAPPAVAAFLDLVRRRIPGIRRIYEAP